MSDLERAADHEVLPVERAGDLLIVTPAGDLVGFSPATFQSEFQRVKQLAARPEFRNVLIDLSRSAYFGSEMIGALIDLRRAVASSHGQPVQAGDEGGGSIVDGGVTAVCGLSDDMRAGLRIMNVDTLLLTFNDRPQAVRTLAKRSVGDRVAGLDVPWTWIVAFLLVAIVIGLIAFTSIGFRLFGGSAESDYRQIVSLYERWDKTWERTLLVEENVGRGRGFVDEITEIKARVDGQDITDERRAVMTAADRLVDLIWQPTNPGNRKAFAADLETARDAIEESTGVTLEFPSTLERPEKKAQSGDDASETNTTTADKAASEPTASDEPTTESNAAE